MSNLATNLFNYRMALSVDRFHEECIDPGNISFDGPIKPWLIARTDVEFRSCDRLLDKVKSDYNTFKQNELPLLGVSEQTQHSIQRVHYMINMWDINRPKPPTQR